MNRSSQIYGNIANPVLILALILTFPLLLSCGQETRSTQAVPQVQDPLDTPKQKLEIPPAQGTDPRLPDLTRAVSIQLTDKVTYTALKDLAGEISLPLVGDPKISMAYNPSGTIGNILLAFEDKWGFWGASIPSFEKTGTKSSTSFDMIFSDNELIVRVKGTLNADSFVDPSTIYYRIRKPGENACKKQVTTCDIIDPGLNWGPFTCPYPQPDTLTPCLQYMNVSNPEVKVIGKFIGPYSTWATAPEGN